MRLLLLSAVCSLILGCDSAPSVRESTAIADETGFISEEIEMVDQTLNSPPPPMDPGIQSQAVEHLKIIKKANLRFETEDLAATNSRIQQAVRQLGGYIQDDQSGTNYDQQFHSLSIRVPATSFNDLIEAIGEGVAVFDEKSISRQDVTEEFTDVTARLKAKRALEDRYLSLLREAKNVKDMLEIERELAEVREAIERAEGRLNYLSDRVAMSTIHVTFYKTRVMTTTSRSFGSKMKNALKGGWNGLTTFFIGLLYLWPFLILGTLLIFGIRYWVKKRKRLHTSK